MIFYQFFERIPDGVDVQEVIEGDARRLKDGEVL